MNFFSDPPPEVADVFTDGEILLVAQAISFAYGVLEDFRYHQHVPFSVEMYEQEDEINSRIVEILNRMLKSTEVAWFDFGTFQNVHRDSKSATLENGIDKMPDMVFCKQNLGSYSPRCHSLDVECKVISNKGSQRVSDYVKDGVMRFVEKFYARFTSQAMMCAYTIPGSKPSEKLSKYFATLPVGHKNLPYQSVSGWQEMSVPFSASVCTSRHERREMQEVNIMHLWLAKDKK